MCVRGDANLYFKLNNIKFKDCSNESRCFIRDERKAHACSATYRSWKMFNYMRLAFATKTSIKCFNQTIIFTCFIAEREEETALNLKPNEIIAMKIFAAG